MTITGAAVLYTTIWFICLFVLLPFGQRSQAEAGHVVPGTPPGAPAVMVLGRKAIGATFLSLAVFAVLGVVIYFNLITRADVLSLDWLTH